MLTQLHDTKVLYRLALFLVFTVGLFPSWSLAAEGQPGTAASSISQSQKEQADKPNRTYHDYALFIAGMNNPKGSLAALESSPAWGQFAKSFSESWRNLEGGATYADEGMGRPGAQHR